MESTLLLSRDGLARRWRKSPKKIREWTEAGLLPTFTDPDSGRIVYPLGMIEKWERGEWSPSV